MGYRSRILSFSLAVSLLPLTAVETSAAACSVKTARNSVSTATLCDCTVVDSKMLRYLSRRADFGDILARTSAACPAFAAVLTDFPTASVGTTAREPGDGRPDDPRVRDRVPDDNPGAPGPNPDGDKKPDSDDKTPKDKDKQPDGDDKKPKDKDKKPDGDDKKPKDKDKKPDGDDKKPKDKDKKPDGHDKKPKDKDKKPDGDSKKPKNKDKKPDGDSKKPKGKKNLTEKGKNKIKSSD